jgi:uncharacterized membrane protein HdeD (DUF308 family)
MAAHQYNGRFAEPARERRTELGVADQHVGMPWIWVVLSGAITLLLGLIILAHWPVSSLYILGLFLGIDLVFAGAGWIAVGFGLGRRA